MTNTNNTSGTDNALVEGLFSVGAHFGFVKSRRHPSTKPFIYGVKNKIEIFDLEKTSESLQKALNFIESLGTKSANILFVSGKSESKESLTLAAESISMPYVAGRFIGGTLTNFPEIKKRVEKLESLVSQKEKGELVKYTKKERLLIDREIDRLREFFFGLSAMKSLPHAVFVIDSKKESNAVIEAKKSHIPVVAVTDTNTDPDTVDYPVVANDDSPKAIEFLVSELLGSYTKGA